MTLSRSRRVDWREARKLCALAAATACLMASVALLALADPASAGTVAATPATSSPVTGAAITATLTARTVSCFPLSESGGSCYNAGEFCPDADLNMSGVAANGAPIACESQSGEQQPRWEACTPFTFPATPTSAATAPVTQVCPPTPAGAPTGAGSTSAPSTSTSAPAGAPATGGGTGPGASGTLAAAGGAFIAGGAGLILLSRRRARRGPV